MFLQLLPLFSSLVFLYTHNVHAAFPCSTTNNYTSGSQFQTNLDHLLSKLVSNGSEDGFFNTSIGAVPDIVYGLADCRGDVSMEACGSCLKNVSVEIVQGCPNGKEASYRSERCHIHYSNNRFFSDANYSIWMSVRTTVVSNTDLNPFNTQLDDLMSNLSSTAISRLTRYDSGSIEYKPFNNIYGVVQCTRDISPTDCFTCLKYMISYIPSCCNKSVGAEVFTSSCYIRYETFSFIDVTIEPTSPPPQIPTPPPHIPSYTPQDPPPSPEVPAPAPNGTIFVKGHAKDQAIGKGKGKSSNIVLVAVVPIIGSVAVLAVCAFFVTKRIRKNRRKPDEEIISFEELKTEMVPLCGDHQDEIRSEPSLQYDLNVVRTATNNFSDANKLGEGGFGAVYKGVLLDGKAIAVKRLARNSGQGSKEFKNEVALLHKLQHRNLVRLLGFCLGGEEKLLIYEYLANRSLDKYIFDSNMKTILDWRKRYKIIGDIARGLLYLHEDSRLTIIHRDLKSGNILLDDGMNAKIADFGMAKLFGIAQNHGNTSRIVGTYGYMAPEYHLDGLFSVKSDVFSFGVLLLEIISGKKTRNFRRGSSGDLLSYAWNLWREGNALRLMDDTLLNSYSANEVMKCIHIGLLCVQDNLVDRPTMSSVVFMLKSSSVSLDTPSAPPFMSRSESGSGLYPLSESRTDEKSSSNLYPVDEDSFVSSSSG